MSVRHLSAITLGLVLLSAGCPGATDTDAPPLDDAGTDTVDAGPPSSDAGVPSSDAGPPISDAGVPGGSAFPELLGPFLARVDAAQPAPIATEEPENTTSTTLLALTFSPLFEIQFRAQDPNADLDCPLVDGEFPTEGLPTEPVTVTGGGCTNEQGVTYEGSFTFDQTGIVYQDYQLSRPVEGCEGLLSTQRYIGGNHVNATESGFTAEALFAMMIDGIDSTDCSTVASNFQFHVDATLEEREDGSTLFNGESTVLLTNDAQDFTFQISTIDEVIDDSVCDSEPISGTNTLRTGNDEVVFTFDGDTDCDPEPTQMVSVNGAAPIEVSGASCTTAPGPVTLGWCVGLCGVFLIRRKRRGCRWSA